MSGFVVNQELLWKEKNMGIKVKIQIMLVREIWGKEKGIVIDNSVKLPYRKQNKQEAETVV